MFAFLLMVSSCFFLMTAQRLECSDSCTPCPTRLKQLCIENHVCNNELMEPDVNRQLRTTEVKRERQAETNDNDVITNRLKSGILELVASKAAKDYSPHLLLTKQQLQNLGKCALNDYYMRIMNNYK